MANKNNELAADLQQTLANMKLDEFADMIADSIKAAKASTLELQRTVWRDEDCNLQQTYLLVFK